MLDVKQFLLDLPNRVNPEDIQGEQATFHFDIADAGQFTVRIENDQVSVSEGLTGEATSSVKTSAEAFSKILAGDLNPMMAMMTGKLSVRNPGGILKYAKMFGLM
ncbi:MAG: SCP2 sterol-binding domain-containing protein [Saprospiraceae bacterium]|nr:SCP2 sterol-binding domain-containing protein [Saprospiraceae bacterium]MDW8229747.1 SCP2 sterol-binding domain-containing protein [Saprospiraceae bacterium]